MKNYKLIYLLIIALFLVLGACKELDQPIVLNPSQEALVDTIYISTTTIAPSPKNVLMEEFSGVKCPNCPIGNAKTKLIHSANPTRVNLVTVHSKALASPFSGDQDLRCADADELVSVLGPLGAKPSTFINRSKLQDPTKIVISGDPAGLAQWQPFVEAELNKIVSIKMTLDIKYINVEDRKFRYGITLAFSEAMANINLGFLLTESGMETQQLDGIVLLEEYEHEYVLREFITSILGEGLTEEIVANTVIVKEFEIDLDDFEAQADGRYTNPADWKIDNMDLVAFIRGPNDEIIQSTSIEL